MGNICSMKHISKSFGDKKIFEDFSLEIAEGEMLCVAGASGSGKSTILNMIGMFEKPDSGIIELFGIQQKSINSKEGKYIMRDRIFYLFQNFALVDDKSIDYNMEIPLMNQKKSKKEKKQLKQDALSKVGLNLSLNKKIYQLSGGEQQRVSLARGFLRNFDMILADEPTGSLDAENREIVMKILKKFHEDGKTVVIVSHDQYIIDNTSRVLRIG